MNPTEPILSVRNVSVEFLSSGKWFKAIDDLCLEIAEGETLGLVGESGCGKSTTARAILQLPRPTAGEVVFEGQNLAEIPYGTMQRVRQRLQVIFQDPVSSLNPRRKVKDIVAEPLAIAGIPRDKREMRVRKVLRAVGIDPEISMERRPGQFSGGQCQRICIARALILEPKLIICDEPVSALDVSVQAQILNLLEDMKERYRLTLLFISHDLAVVRNISDRVAVMYLGKLCEVAGSDRIYESPAHPYTAGLISVIPNIEASRANRLGGDVLAGEIPSPLNPPSGCRFHTRCKQARGLCKREVPPLRPIGKRHQVACHFPLDSAARPGGL